MTALAFSAHAATLEGVEVSDSAKLAGETLVLNGAAVRRFSIYKTEVASLYLPSKQNTLEGVTGQSGPKRLQLVALRDIRSDDVTRRFMVDFRAASTQQEWSHLINEMAQFGHLLAHNAKKGDIFTLDWIPDKGLMVTKNGMALADKPMLNDLMFRIVMRIFLGPQAPVEAREKLLGRQPWSE
jgi:hypothetical protein